MKNMLYCAARSLITAAVVGSVFTIPMFTIDTFAALTLNKKIEETVPIEKRINYNYGSIIRAPYETPYTNWALPISAGIGGIGGLAAGINNLKNKKHPLEDL